MNKYIKQLLSLVAVAVVAWGCESDFYNEHMIDGYEPETEITDVQSIEYTLTEDDYSTISKNSTNKTNAEAAGQEAVDALAAIGKNKYFSTPDEAAAYVPAFLASAYPTLDDNSIVMLSYTTALDIPEEIAAMNAATEYTLSEDNYKSIWDSEEEYVKAVTPKTLSKLKSVLPSEGLEAGQYVAVTYNYSAEEPTTGEEPENPDQPVNPDQPEKSYTSVLGSAVLNDAVEVKGYISAVSSQGPILTDNSGSVLMYKTSGYEVGDEVTVTGTISSYNCGFQIGTSGLTIEKTGTTTVTYPAPMELTGAMMDELLTTRTADEYAYFVKITGTVEVSGNFYNFNVPGATTAVGSFYGLTDDQKAQLSHGQECTIYGYFCSISKSGGAPKFVNFVTVSVNEAPAIEAGNNYTSVLGSAVLNDTVEVKGYISAVSSQGPILTDNGGSVLMYRTSGYVVGDEVTVTGTISSYNCGFQIGTSGLTIEKTGTTTVTYPAPMELTGAKMDELLTTRTADEYAYYAKMTGTVEVSGNFYNFNVDGATTAVGSIYGATDEVKGWLTDGLQCTIYGYFCSISKSGGAPKFVNIVVTSVDATATASTGAEAATVTSEKQYAYFKWNGTAFEDTEIVAVQPADYTEMGQTYGNFTNPAQDDYLPKFLGKKHPYAMEGDVAYVAYRCYAGGTTSWKVDEYISDGTLWNKTNYFASKTDQFRKTEGVWAIDRTLELDYTGNGADTKAFYQYCTNWVYDNKDVPMGAPARDNAGVILSTDIVTINGEKPAGNYWVSNYGNNEFYTGASAYYGNIDWRASACKGGFAAAGMGDLTDEEIVEQLKIHSAEVFAEVLSYMYPDMTPAEYKKVVIKVYAFGPNLNYAFTFDVVDTGKFQYVEGSLAEI